MPTKLKNILFDIFDVVSFLVFVIWIVLFIRFFIFNPFSVVGMSMYPTFQEWDFIVVDKISPNFWELKRWDVIVFVPPGKNIPYIKRIIGLPWETIKINSWNVTTCTNDDQCTELDEKYLPSDFNTKAECEKNEFKIDWWYFVLGDNRWNSTDSLCCFSYSCYEDMNFVVPDEYIIWKVFVRLFPNFQSNFAIK